MLEVKLTFYLKMNIFFATTETQDNKRKTTDYLVSEKFPNYLFCNVLEKNTKHATTKDTSQVKFYN